MVITLRDSKNYIFTEILDNYEKIKKVKKLNADDYKNNWTSYNGYLPHTRMLRI